MDIDLQRIAGFRAVREIVRECTSYGRLLLRIGQVTRSSLFSNLGDMSGRPMAGPTGLEPATSGVTGRAGGTRILAKLRVS